jgi:hypothetical protein
MIAPPKKAGASRGSPRSFATQKRLAQDDNFKLTHYRSLAHLDRNRVDGLS